MEENGSQRGLRRKLVPQLSLSPSWPLQTGHACTQKCVLRLRDPVRSPVQLPLSFRHPADDASSTPGPMQGAGGAGQTPALQGIHSSGRQATARDLTAGQLRMLYKQGTLWRLFSTE